MVLGGGRGTRLFPLTEIRSKPAVPLGGKYRLIDIPLSNCINSSINKIFVVTQYNSASLNRHVTQTYRFGLFSQGFVDILAAEQTPESANWFQGTADAVRQCLRHILSYNVDQVLVLSGDQLYRMNYRKLMKAHRDRDADVSVCVLPVARRRAGEFGILKMAPDGRLTEFHEKPTDPELIRSLEPDPQQPAVKGLTKRRPLLGSMGIYVFNRDALIRALEDSDKVDFGRDVIPWCLDAFKVVGHLFNGYWEDIGTIGAFFRANLDLTTEKPKFTFFDADFPIYTHPRFLPASRIRDCGIVDSVIAEGCSIYNSQISHSVIGIRSIVRSADIQDTLMMGADVYEHLGRHPIRIGVGSGSIIRDAIIDKNARIGRNVQVLNKRKRRHYDGKGYHIRDGIVVIPKNAVIPDGTVI